MTRAEFKPLRYFTASEVERTGASIADVQRETMYAIDDFRHEMGIPVRLLFNGITSGNHKSAGHPNGLAVDCTISGTVDVGEVFKNALIAGFKAIGIYWNGAAYSFHLELADRYRFWSGRKAEGEAKWTYGRLIVDPKEDA